MSDISLKPIVDEIDRTLTEIRALRNPPPEMTSVVDLLERIKEELMEKCSGAAMTFFPPHYSGHQA